jgi:uncharacterized protein
LDPVELQRLREASGLRLDSEGRFFHRGELITHARTVEVLHRGVHRAPDGRWATRIGSEWGYLEVEDAALFVQEIDGARARMLTGEWEPIESLSLGLSDVLYARIRGERARLSRDAQLSLDLREESPGKYFSGPFAIGVDTGHEPRRVLHPPPHSE